MTAFLLATFLLACGDPNIPIDASDTTEILLEVPKGTSPTTLRPILATHGLVGGEWEWKAYVKQNPEKVTCLKAGKFSVNKGMSLNQVMVALCGAPLANDVPFTVVEGWRIRDIDAALAKAGHIQAGEYIAVAEKKTVPAPFKVTSPSYEGYLWPETYMVSPDRVTAGSFVTRQLKTFEQRFLNDHKDQVSKRGLHDIVVMASMLEREEPKLKNRPLVAGILWKRIDAKTPLGVDATSRYRLVHWNDRKAFLANLRDPSEPYNTRKNTGLPPTAIGNPTLSSLQAALAPEKSPYWYYLHDAKGNIHPGRNGAEHEANRRKYNVW